MTPEQVTEMLNAILPPEEQLLIRDKAMSYEQDRAAASYALEQAATLAYSNQTPASLSAFDHALTRARRCGVTQQEIRNALHEARKGALHGG